MSHTDFQDNQEVTLIDFEGIENITKFKYRKTKPLYPKPGTFYWVEESVHSTSDKLGLYFTTNDCELKRLDSKVYKLVVKNEDEYVQITDPDEFDKQEIYLVIGNFVKGDVDGDVGIFKLNDFEKNKGLATVEATIEYVSDSHNMLYKSDVEESWKVGVRLGDIRKGYTKENIKNKTISEILDTIIYPTLQPEVTQPSVTITDECLARLLGIEPERVKDGHVVISYGENLKISGEKENEKIPSWETIIENKFNNLTTDDITSDELDKEKILLNRGYLTYPTENREYAGEPDLNTIKVSVSSVDDNEDNRYKITISVEFDDGEQPLDNKGGVARYEDLIDGCDCEGGCDNCIIPKFERQYITSNEIIIDVVYPVYTNTKLTQTGEDEILIDYHLENGGDYLITFNPETDGDIQLINPVKMYVDVPQYLKLEVYQYNEFTQDYDVKIEMIPNNTSTHTTQYMRYLRTNVSTDTNIDSVKYKIIIKKP